MEDQKYLNMHQALQHWGAWKSRGLFGSSRVKYSRMQLASEPGEASFFKACISCRNIHHRGGKSMVRDIYTGEYSLCRKCMGRGGQWVAYPLVDPVAIPGRNCMGASVVVPISETFKLIEDGLKGLTIQHQAVVLSRYVFCPNTKESRRLNHANRIIEESQKKRISGIRFGWLLRDSRRRLSEITGISLETRRNLTGTVDKMKNPA